MATEQPIGPHTKELTMPSNPNHEDLNLAQRIGRLSVQALKAIAVLCGESRDKDVITVTAYRSHDEVSLKFRHAIEMERAFSDTVLNFDEIEPPCYRNSISIDLIQMAAELGVARVHCVVAMGIDEVVTGMRDYADVEMTVLEAVAEQLTRLHDLLDHPVDATMTIRVLQ